MKRNYLLVYEYKNISTMQHRYFETIEDMKDFIKFNLIPKRHYKVLYKYEIKEVK